MFDRATLIDTAKAHGTVARVVVASVKGSTPREAGASMLVWADGQSGTIGGGQLEFQAATRARAMLPEGSARVDRAALGPALNQCCGGAVTLVTEVFDVNAAIAVADGTAHLRRVEGSAEVPPTLTRAIQRHAAMGTVPAVTLSAGWLLEPMWRPARAVVIYGAGHVGQALASVLAPLPDFDVTLADDRTDVPTSGPTNVGWKSDGIPTALSGAPDDAMHIVMTHSHELDLQLCHALLSRTTGGIGLIGSATKWARFSKRLQALGHSQDQIARIECPIGDPALGKHPQAIAVGVASRFLRNTRQTTTKKEAC